VDSRQSVTSNGPATLAVRRPTIVASLAGKVEVHEGSSTHVHEFGAYLTVPTYSGVNRSAYVGSVAACRVPLRSLLEVGGSTSKTLKLNGASGIPHGI
jgi:hypothetical protein